MWEGSAAPGAFERTWPQLLCDAAQYVDHTPVWEGDAAAVAAGLLERAPQSFLPGATDPYDLDGPEAEAPAEYPFLQDWTDARFAELYDTLAQRLRAGYGPPLPDDRAVFLRRGDGERSVTWQVGDRLLVLQEWAVIGDGGMETEIWLAALEA
ncbi:hypothetical protein [Streptomyces virginiae]|uniref:hypothetical protein n=1 Tax=Streptomyces virginiae TaxID=1961 RepID=UPI002DB9E5BD|nr:hypothetical protein [Streptomyces sp. CMAA1738]MEC4570760.1 hypothetical protein [Streptomyces sp. CMAA1738]